MIRVESLGKKYRLDQLAQRQRYTALRDVIAEKTKRLLQVRGAGRVPGVKGRGTEDFWALKDVSFEIAQGETVGIIGRNGAGKSTLLKILSRITEPTSGRVRLRGRVASLLEVGTGFHPELTGRENIYLNGTILGMTRAEIRRRFDEIVAFAEIEKFLDTPVKRYSSGMYVRLAFAVAAHLEPEILVVDEVLAVGDAEFQKKCLGKMESAAKYNGRTVLFVSHNMTAVQALCGTALLLERGELRRMGPVDRVLAEYSSNLTRLATAAPNIVTLGPTLRLGRLHFKPLSPKTGQPLLIAMQLVPLAPSVLREIAILIHSDFGARIAILDLRGKGFLELALLDDPVCLEVRIERLPLVEGDYRLGLYVATSEQSANYLDIAALTVRAADTRNPVIPYPVEHRGFVDLEFSVRTQACEKVLLDLQ